jgi:hypothetical protein
MPAPKHQVHPEHPDDVVCDTCTERSPWMDSVAATLDRARFKGWRVFDGFGLTGKPIKVACCPACFRTGAPARPLATAVMEDQMELPGLITPVPVAKSKRNKRQMS